MSRSSPIIILADDLSGAAELAGIAFAHGLTAEVQRRFEPSTNAHVIAIDTDTRHLTGTVAAERVRQITLQVLATPHAWLFKKVDSVLRGNVSPEVEAILTATGQRRAILVPANPTRGRRICGGRYSIDGIPLDQTPFADDPDHPRKSADIAELLTGHCHLKVHNVRVDEPLLGEGILVPDIDSESQLDQLASIVCVDTLAVGAADFFNALLNHRCKRLPHPPQSQPLWLDSPRLLVCGSRIAWPQRLAECESAHLPIHLISELAWWPGGDGKRLTRFVAALLGIGTEMHPEPDRALRLLAAHASDAVSSFEVKVLLAEGGATAAKIAEEMGWERFEVAAVASAGVGVLQPLSAAAPIFLIKPGSYPWPPEIWQSLIRP